MSVMMQCQCPACGRSSRIPVDEALPCCWCGNLLNTSAEKKAAPLAEPEPKPKIRLEKAPRVNLSKDDLPASSAAALPQRVPKSQPVMKGLRRRVPKATKEGWSIRIEPIPPQPNPLTLAEAITKVLCWIAPVPVMYALQNDIVGYTKNHNELLCLFLFFLGFLACGLIPMYAVARFPAEALERLGLKNAETGIYKLVLAVGGMILGFVLFFS